MIENKRKHFRLNSLNLLHIEVYENNLLIKQGIAKTLNVSESGILLETHFPIKPECNILVTIGLKDDLVAVDGKIIHSMQGIGGKYKTGIKFKKINKSGLEILKGYIADFTSEKNIKEN